MTTPARIQLRRARGFNLQAASMALNELPAISVVRPGKLGNPFTVVAAIEAGYKAEHAVKMSVYAFEQWLNGHRDYQLTNAERQANRAVILKRMPELRGKNLACWCRPGAPCHADVLLKIANRPVCEEVK